MSKSEEGNEGRMINSKIPSDEDTQLVESSFWMIRNCAVYDSEKSLCSGLHGRFYQYYIEGKMADCNAWLQIMKDCRKWNQEDDITAGARIIRHEKERIRRRVESRLQNDVWARREERPPPNWNDPLPQFILDQHEDSYLSEYQHELDTNFQPEEKKSRCSIS